LLISRHTLYLDSPANQIYIQLWGVFMKGTLENNPQDSAQQGRPLRIE